MKKKIRGEVIVGLWVFAALVSILCYIGNSHAAPANWYRSDEGLTLPSSPTSAPDLFSFYQRVYVHSDTDLYIQLYNYPCFGWKQVTIPAGCNYFKPVGDHLYASGSGLWITGPSDDVPVWFEVSSTGVPIDAAIRPETIFKGQLYASVVTMEDPSVFDIYRTPDIGKASMTWSKVVSLGFMNPTNHQLGTLIEYNDKLIAITTNTRTDPGAISAAINALNKGNKKAAIGILNSFILMVNGQRGKGIADDQADSWIAEAKKIIDSINAS